jgi:hypothetical protein
MELSKLSMYSTAVLLLYEQICMPVAGSILSGTSTEGAQLCVIEKPHPNSAFAVEGQQNRRQTSFFIDPALISAAGSDWTSKVSKLSPEIKPYSFLVYEVGGYKY